MRARNCHLLYLSARPTHPPTHPPTYLPTYLQYIHAHVRRALPRRQPPTPRKKVSGPHRVFKIPFVKATQVTRVSFFRRPITQFRSDLAFYLNKVSCVPAWRYFFKNNQRAKNELSVRRQVGPCVCDVTDRRQQQQQLVVMHRRLLGWLLE